MGVVLWIPPLSGLSLTFYTHTSKFKISFRSFKILNIMFTVPFQILLFFNEDTFINNIYLYLLIYMYIIHEKVISNIVFLLLFHVISAQLG